MPDRLIAPSRYTEHALERFIERWGPMRDPAEALRIAVATRATHVENVPNEQQSIWGFVVLDGPRRGDTALIVVSADGTVRTVLPSGSKCPPTRRRPPPATKQRRLKSRRSRR